jgi:hypothetical protein
MQLTWISANVDIIAKRPRDSKRLSGGRGSIFLFKVVLMVGCMILYSGLDLNHLPHLEDPHFLDDDWKCPSLTVTVAAISRCRCWNRLQVVFVRKHDGTIDKHLPNV